MTTVQALRLMAEYNSLLISEETEALLTKAAAELEALQKEVEEAKRSAKFWEEEAARFCRNEFFYRDLIVKTGELFGVAARTSDDGSIQQDVLALKVPELVNQLRTQNRELREACRLSQIALKEYDLLVANGDFYFNCKCHKSGPAQRAIEQVLAQTEVTNTAPPMTKNKSSDFCEICGSPEVDATTPRTVYSCGSSDYDKRPGSFKQGEKCARIKEVEG